MVNWSWVAKCICMKFPSNFTKEKKNNFPNKVGLFIANEGRQRDISFFFFLLINLSYKKMAPSFKSLILLVLVFLMDAI